MPENAIRHAFNDKAPPMSITVLNLTEASSLLRTIHKRDIKDVRAIDLDLALVMENGHKIIISRGAVAAANTPQLVLEFADGDVAIGDVFEKLNHIEVPPETAGTFTVSETKRYGIKRVSKPKSAKNDQDQESDKDNHDEGAARPDHSEPGPAEALGSDGGATAARTVQTVNASGAGSSSALAAQDIPEAAANSGGSSNAGGISWPAIAGGLGLLAAAGGGGGGGGGGAAAAQSAPASAAAISGAAVLGPLNNATITAYDAEGRVIGKATPVVNGRYSMVLERPGYKGLILLAVRDNTPGVADNYADEATLRVTDLGNTVLRAAALADGSNQIINVTALTELAALMAGVTTGQTSLAAAKVGAAMVSGANTAISNLFKVNIIAGDVVAVTTIDAQGAAVINPEFARSTSVTARNYGIALKSISNLTPTDPVRYGNHDSAIKKLADSLQFTDALLTRLKWSDSTTQSDLFGERLNARANDPALTAAERQQARTLYEQLQNLPNGGNVTEYLLQSHVAVLEPTILIKNTTPDGPQWRAPSAGNPLILDQNEVANGGLAVRAPPQSKVEVTFIGHNAQGQEVRVTLPPTVADGNGIAVLRPTDAALNLFKQMTRERPVSAQVAVTDGDNSRSNAEVWKTNADVRIDLNTPPGLTDFASNKIMLVNDSFYTGGEGNDPLRTTPQGNDDLLTSDPSVRVVLANAIKQTERLQFAVATTKGADGQPIYGNWIDPAGLAVERIDSGGQVHYLAPNLVNTDGQVWVKARVVQIGAQFTNGFGGARELDTPLQFTLDKTAPVKVQLAMAENRDDGVSTSDGISRQSQVTLDSVAAFETGAEVHLRLATAAGTSNTTLQVLRTDGTRVAIEPGTWIRWSAGDKLQLIGESGTFNGKARLEVRQIDQAGNYTDSVQTFIADRSQVIEQTVPLANREKAVIEAKAAVVAAVQAADLATGADKAAKQAALTAARTALQAAQTEREQALDQARIALTKSDGSTRLADLIGKPVDAAYLPAILRAVAATADPDKVNEARGLTALVDSTIAAANQALEKARIYGDNDSNPAPSSADFEHMGIAGTEQQGTLTLANAALKTLPAARSDSIAAIRNIVDAAARVAALADGLSGNATDANLPDAATYATLGVATALTPAAARVLGQVIDGKALHEVATTGLIESIAGAALRVTQFAAGINLSAPLTAQDFSALGISGVTADNVGRLADQLRAVPPSLIASGKVSGVVDTLDEIRAIVALDLGTLQTLMNYAQNITPIDPANTTLTEPTLAQYAHPDLAAAGAQVTADRLPAINSALRGVGVTGVDTWSKVAGLVKSYTLILNAADGAANGTPATLPTEADFQHVGVKSLQNRFPSGSGDAARSNAVKLLAQVVDRSTAAEVDTSAKLDTLADIASRIIRIAAGQPETVTADEWKRLHIGRDYTAEALRVVLPAIAGTADDGSAVNTPATLAVLANEALGSAERIRQYAGNEPGATEPLQEDYRNLGITGVDDVLTVASINSVLASATISAPDVHLPGQIQAIVTAYARILGQVGNADGARALPGAHDFELIGVTPPQSPASLSLLNSALARGGKQRTDIDTVSELTDLIRASDTVLHIAAGNLSDLPGAPATHAATLQTLLTKLGVTGLQPDSMPAVLAVLKASADDGGGVDTLAKLQTLVTNTSTAQNRIHAYADDASQPAPGLADYAGTGVTGADVVGANALNSLLAGTRIGKTQVATPEQLQGIVDSFARILSEANEVPGANLDVVPDATPGNDPLLGDYSKLGLTLWGLTDPAGPSDKTTEHLSLLNDVLHRKSRDQVDSLGKLEALGAAVALFIDNHGVSALDAAGRQKWADAAALLGVRNLVTSGEGENLEALIQALRTRTANQIDTVEEIQALLEGSNGALSKIIAYATDSLLNPAPTLEDYTATGITAGSNAVSVNVNNLASINASVAKLNGPDVNSRSKLGNVVQAYNLILAAADGTAGDGSGNALQASHYTTIGVNLASLARSSANSATDADKLALFNSVVGARNQIDVSTPERLESLAATVSDLIRLARESVDDPLSAQKDSTLSLARLQALGLGAITNEATRSAFLNAVQFKGNRVDPVTWAPRSEDNVATHDVSGVNSVETLAAMATSYATLLGWINNGSTSAPTQADYQNVGIQLPTTNPTSALLLLNSALHAQPDASRINTIAGLNRMALVVEQLMKAGSIGPLGGGIALTVEDLQWLGVTGVTSDNLGFVLSKLQSLTDPGSVLVSLAALQSLATAAINAREHLVKLAQDNTGALATAADLDAIGLTLPVNGAGSNAEYLKLFNDALKSPAIDGSRANTPTLLQAIIGAAQRVVDSTLGHAPASATHPNPTDLIALGLPPGEVARVPAADMTLLIDAITARSFSNLGVDHTGTALALPAKLSHLLGVIASVRNSAATGLASTDLSAAHLEELGLTLSAYNNAAGTPGHHLPAILSAIAASRSNGSEVGSLAALQTLVTRAASAQDKILHYADEAGSPTADAPTAEDYRAIGLVRPETDASGTRIALVSPDRVAAINAALHASGIGPDRADTPAGIKRVVTAYNAILDSANGTAGDTTVALTGEHYRDIGVTIAGVTAPSGGGRDGAILSLFNSLIDSLSAADVATPARIEALGATVGKLIGLAGQPRTQPVSNAPASGELARFGIQSLSDDERDAFIAVLQTKALTDFDTLGEVQTLATSVRAAYARVIAYAETNGGAVPTLADYQALAITGISDNAGHREAVNAALATSAVKGSTVAKLNFLQAVVDSYRLLLQQADGTADNTATADLAKLEHFENIGVDMTLLKQLDATAAGASGNAIQLLSSLVDSRRATAVDTPQELQQLVSVVHKLALAAQGLDTSPLQAADFALIGLPVNDAAVVAQIRAQLALLPDDGSGLNTWSQLRTLLLSVTGVPTWDVVAGDDIINLAERTAGVTFSGSAGQNDVLTLFYPDSTVMKSGIAPRDAGGGRFTWSYTLTAEDWTRLGANSADGVERILQLQARNTSTSVDSIKVAHRVTIDTVAPPANLVVTLEQDTGISATDGITSNGKVKVTGVAADAQWEYRIGSAGDYQAGMGDSFTVTAQGAQTVSVRQFDRAGNRSAAQTLNLTLDTQAPEAPVIALNSVGGTVNDLPVTNNDTVKVSGLEPGARLQWRLNRNDYTDNPAWIDASDTTINPIGLAANQVRNVYLEMRQLDVAGNAGSVSRLGFTLDTTPPPAPGLTLVGARGDAASGLFSNTGVIDIASLEPLGRWEYSVNGGTTFVAGSGSRLTLPAGDGAKTVIVRQYDLAGNHTDSLPLAFTLDTGRPAAPTPVLRLDSGALANDGITTDGTVRIDNLEPGATWEYSLDNGTTWSTTGITGNTVNFTDNGTRRSLQVRQTDRAGNVSDPSAKLDFTVDTTPPRTPRLALVNNSSGDEATHLSNDGRIDVLDLDAGTVWEFSTDGGTSWTNGSGNRFTVSGDGAKRLQVRQTDAAGNTSTSSVLSMQLDTTAPAKPGLPSLVADTGRDGTDRITSDARLQPPAASEAGLRFEYSFDGIAWNSFNQSIRGTRDGGSDGVKTLKVSSIDRAGNRSVASDDFSFTLDTVAPAKLVPTLLKPVSGGSTIDGTVLIGTQETGSVWEYSLDRGATWTVGTGDRFKIKGRDEGGTDGVKSVQLRQTDAAGNSSVSEVLEFNLLTKLDAPGLSVVAPLRILPDRTVLLDVGDSSVLPLGSKMVLEVSGRAGMTAIVTRDDGREVGRVVLDATGKGRLEVGRTLTLSGLKTVSGADTTANAVYELVQSGDTIIKLRNTSPAYFGAEFSDNGVPLVDMSKPVYRTGPADSDWYVWSAQGGGYIISRRGNSGEWYREAPSSQPAQTPESVKSWVAVNRSASLVAEEQFRNSGASSHQRTLEGVGVVNSNGWRETPWTYKAIQQSSPDNRSEPTEVKVRMFTTNPPALDLDAATSGVQGNLVLPATRSELLGGLSLFASSAAPAGNTTRSMELVLNNKSAANNRPISNNDLLVLDGTEVRMDVSRARVDNLSVGGVGGVSYETVVNADQTTTLTISKTSGGAFTGAEVRNVLAAIKLRNSLDLATGFDQRTIDVKLIDDTGRRSFDNARVTVQVEGYGLQVDLNNEVAGIQRSSKRYLNNEFVSTSGLTEGTPFARNIAAPTGTPEGIVLKFSGVHPINEMFYSSDATVATPSGGVQTYFGSIAGVYGLLWWSPREGEVQIRKTSTANFTGEEVKRIVEGVRLVTTTRNDIERSMEITLVGPGTAFGATSRATLVVDTRAPDLDLDASQAGNQTTVNTIVPRNQAIDGVKLFKGDVTAPLAGDTAKVVLTLPVPAGTSPAGSEKIVLNADKRLPTTIDFNITSSIGGVDGLAIRYTAATRELSISRQDGASLPGIQVKAILEGIRYSFPPNPDLSSGLNNEHRFEIALVDQAGNTSKGRVDMSTLRTIPASLAVSVVDGQFGYGLIKMSNVFGSSAAPLSFPAVLTRSEEAIPTLPAGFTAASLLQAIRGISAEWGGKGVSGDGNTSIGSLKSYQMFDKLGTGTTSFSLLQQGSSLDTLGAWLRLGLKPAGAAGLNNVTLEMLGGFKRNSVDQYKVSPDLETGLSDVGLANIGLLYQLSVVNTSSRPVLRVRFDSSHNVPGNVIELYEGGRLVGSKTLTASDLGGGPKEVDVTVFQSLSAGKHDLEIRYTDTGGNAVSSNLSLDVTAGGAPVTLTDLAVRGNKQSAAEAQSLGQSGTSYAVISDADTSFASGHGNLGPVFVGKVGGGDAADRYLVTIQMGGKVVAFEDVGAGSFSIGIPAGILPPGYYQDLSISATVLTAGARLGQTTSMQGLKLGWYWAAQAGTAIVGGNGNDELVLGAAADPEAPGGILVQTGAGDDRITVGSFGKTSALRATVTDFTIGMDRVKVFDQIVNQDFVKNFVTASDLNGSTQLQIDLDGAGAGRLYYHLTLQGVQYNPSTIGSIFGV